MAEPFEEHWTLGSTLEVVQRVFFVYVEALAWKERVGGVLLEKRFSNGVRAWEVTWWG